MQIELLALQSCPCQTFRIQSEFNMAEKTQHEPKTWKGKATILEFLQATNVATKKRKQRKTKQDKCVRHSASLLHLNPQILNVHQAVVVVQIPCLFGIFDGPVEISNQLSVRVNISIDECLHDSTNKRRNS